MKLTDIEKEKILQLHRAGESSRSIARKVLGREKRKSTVTDYLSLYREQRRQDNEPFSLPDTPHLKILILDIETSPCISYHWKRWKENIGQDQAISESFILTYAAKWLDDEFTMYSSLEGEEVSDEDDSRLVKDLHELLSLADIVVAHNGAKFDIPVINTRILFHHMKPPVPFKTVDTYKIAKALFRFPSNSLDSLAAYLDIGRKTKTGGFPLWRDYMKGDLEAMETMVAYNIDDVELLEEVYLRLRAWDKRHPNVAVNQEECCPCCGSTSIAKLPNFIYTAASKFNVHTCRECGKKFRTRVRMKVSNDYVNIL